MPNRYHTERQKKFPSGSGVIAIVSKPTERVRAEGKRFQAELDRCRAEQALVRAELEPGGARCNGGRARTSAENLLRQVQKLEVVCGLMAACPRPQKRSAADLLQNCSY